MQWSGGNENQTRANGYKFKDEDLSQAVRYGQLMLENQPFRDQATVCLCTLELVQFFRVFRHLDKIHATNASPIVSLLLNKSEEGMQLLYSFIMASPFLHGRRRVVIPK